jgi:hypothetical protein
MLDLEHEASVSQFDWDTLGQKTRLPERLRRYFSPRGVMPVHPDSRRSYHRFYLRSKAILQRGETQLGVYTADASRKGIRFLSPVELMPQEQLGIRLPTTKEFQIEITRCRRLDEECYECGARFVAS